MFPKAGLHYPGSYAEFLAWFADDGACLDYLAWLRWRDGFECPWCSSAVCWEMAGGILRCADCRRRVSPTAGTIFHQTRTPLSVWFSAAWQMTTQKQGISALGLQRVLGLGSYQTAWAMTQRFRTTMDQAGRDLLSGKVEVDETFAGGVRPGKRGRGAAGKAIVLVAVELLQPTGFWPCPVEGDSERDRHHAPYRTHPDGRTRLGDRLGQPLVVSAGRVTACTR